MHDIRHRVGVLAPRTQVYTMLASRSGLEAVWTDHVEGESEPGAKLAFYFGGPQPAAVMEILELSPDERVRWGCVEGPQEWVDTTLTFDIRESDAETVVLFTHAGWEEPSEFMHHCSTKWATVLIGLRSGLEGGSFTAFPDDARISSSWR
ncbi:MAG TPA: SRPBCC domain-containing protein [Actinomycetes bacterium]|nr:SRPBCC domain-containing protein [Actinomycetes bacterium]